MFNFNGKTNVNIIVNSRLKIHNYNNPSVHNFRLRRRRLVAIKLEQITRPLIVCEITMTLHENWARLQNIIDDVGAFDV